MAVHLFPQLINGEEKDFLYTFIGSLCQDAFLGEPKTGIMLYSISHKAILLLWNYNMEELLKFILGTVYTFIETTIWS